MGQLVCRELRLVSVEEEILVLEDFGLLRPPNIQHITLAPTSFRREVGMAHSNQSACQDLPWTWFRITTNYLVFTSSRRHWRRVN